MRSSANPGALALLASIVGRLNQDVLESTAPHLSAYLNAVEFDIKNPQKILADFIESDTYQTMLALIREQLGEIVFHDNTDEEFTGDNKIHICLQRDDAGQIIRFLVSPREKVDILFFLDETEKQANCIRDNKCTYVDNSESINALQRKVELFVNSITRNSRVLINDNLGEIVKLVLQYNKLWGDFVPMSFKFTKTKPTEGKVTLEWHEKHLTYSLTSPSCKTSSMVPFVEEGLFKDVVNITISSESPCQVDVTSRTADSELTIYKSIQDAGTLNNPAKEKHQAKYKCSQYGLFAAAATLAVVGPGVEYVRRSVK